MITDGRGGLPRITIENEACSAEIYLHGAHVTRWRPHGGRDVLWMSERAVFAAGAPIRGGVPLCWPWFGPHPANPHARAHGFARTRAWTLESIDATRLETRVRLSLSSDDESRALWPHDFALTLEARFGAALDIALTTRNTGDAPFTITEALHTYLAVDDVGRAVVTGLDGAPFADKVHGGAHVQRGPLLFTAETDRVYEHSGDCELHDGARRVIVAKSGSRSTVVWNPWIEKAARMSDFGDDEWTGMLCIEAANTLDAAVTVAPGEAHTIGTTVRA
jgi:glucose-6-phosphate 1-epimerase